MTSLILPIYSFVQIPDIVTVLLDLSFVSGFGEILKREFGGATVPPISNRTFIRISPMPKVPTNIKSKLLVEQRREQIINAASNLFVLKGFHRTTLREIAKEAGISLGNIYDYVGNKEDILFLVYNYVTSKIVNVLDEILEEVDDPVEQLKRLISSEINMSFMLREASLMVYQESKALTKDRLKELLKNERKRMERFESAIEKCVQKHNPQKTNPRLVANLIKVMADVWILKGWDLRGHATKYNIEKTILDAVFKGILKINVPEAYDKWEQNALERQSVLVVNGGTAFCESLCKFLSTKGATVVNLVVSGPSETESKISTRQEFQKSNGTILHSGSDDLNSESITQFLANNGNIDHIIYSWEFLFDNQTPSVSLSEQMDKKLRDFIDTVPILKKSLGNVSSGGILHIAPSFWDRKKDGLLYESLKARLVGITRHLSAELADAGIKINCIIPGFIDGIQQLNDEVEEVFNKEASISLRLSGKQDDLLAAILFLLSDSSRYVSGQILELNGGKPFNC